MSHVIELRQSDLTMGERLWIKRKFRWRLGQGEASARLGYSRQRYCLMERGHAPVRRLREGTYGAYAPGVGVLRPREVLALLQRRSGHTQRDLATLMGWSDPHVRKLTEEAPDRLLAWWATYLKKK